MEPRFPQDNEIAFVRTYRERLLADPYRPGYHYAIPDSNGRPGDPNGTFYADGRYHLLYEYWNTVTQAYHWGHISSGDLLHWRNHPDALVCSDGSEGFYGGSAFVDEDGTAYLSVWVFGAADGSNNGGIMLAKAAPPYDKWEPMDKLIIESGPEWGITPTEINGKVELVATADPSNIWKDGEYYYMQTGNKPVLDRYGRQEDSPPCYQGDWTELFRSKDLKNWEYLHRFYMNTHAGEDWPDRTEDNMCPVFLPLYDAPCNGKKTGKWLELFLSHNRGTQYYIGTWENETFSPEQHGRMSWVDDTVFAPDALIDNKNRCIMWSWLLGNPKNDMERFGWSGVYNFPRQLWLEDGTLHMKPVSELDRLQINHQSFGAFQEQVIPVKNGESFRMKATIDLDSNDFGGFRIRATSTETEFTDIYVSNGKLVMDTSKSGCDGRMVKEEAPFALNEGELLELDIFVDKAVIEVYANHRQAICRRVFPSNASEATRVSRLPGTIVRNLDVWEILPSNPY